MKNLIAAALAAVCTAAAFLPLAASGKSSYQEILNRPRPAPDQHIA